MSKRVASCVCRPKRLIDLVQAGGGQIGQLYRAVGMARSTAYAWWARFLDGGEAALGARRRGPKAGQGRWARWQDAVLALRRRWPYAGPRKLRHLLRQEHPRRRLPSLRTIARMLRAAGGVNLRRVPRLGPRLARPKLTAGTRSNAVWTIDFKGHFYTGDGARCLPLTVRDLYRCYILALEHLPLASDQAVRQVLRRCFRRYGLPRVMRVDNGTPFGGEGARGLTTLSVWWTRLGIRVEFIRPAKPQDNGAHEQMHGVLKRQTAQPPAVDLRAQQRRFRRFCREYNEQRPHEKLGMRVPAKVYRPAPRALPKLAELRYPKSWARKRVGTSGLIYWAGKMRIIGRAFQGQSIGLKPIATTARTGTKVWEVYLGKMLLGELHAGDPSALRAVGYVKRKRRKKHSP